MNLRDIRIKLDSERMVVLALEDDYDRVDRRGGDTYEISKEITEKRARIKGLQEIIDVIEEAPIAPYIRRGKGRNMLPADVCAAVSSAVPEVKTLTN